MNANEIVQLTAHKFMRSKLEVSSRGKLVAQKAKEEERQNRWLKSNSQLKFIYEL